MKKHLNLLCVSVIIFVLATALPAQAASKQESKKKAAPREQPKPGGALVFGMGKEFANPNPFVGTSSVFQFVKETCYESLLTLDDDEKIVPQLAESYEVSSNGAGLTLHLRRGVRFHNGKEMRAEDVIWSVQHTKEPKNGAMGQNLINDIKAAEKIDDYTVKLTLFTPSVPFLSHLSNIRMLPIVPANSLHTGQVKLEKNAFVPGTGPFIMEEYQPGFDTVVKKFPEYWNGPAHLDKIIFRPIADGANRFNALRTGDVHMADRLMALDAARVKKGEMKGVSILIEPVGPFSHLIFNNDSPLFQKLEMRQALAYATDKQRLIEEAFYGAATKTDLMMDSKTIWGKAANIPPQKRDLTKAKTLLKAAGYNGQELVLPGRKSEATLLESYQRMLGEAGIRVKIDILEAGVMKDRLMAGKYDIYVDGGNVAADPNITMMPEYYTTKVEKGRYSNPKVDQLFDNMSAEFDQQKRLKIFRELALTLHNEVASIPLFYEIRFLGISERVRGYGPAPGYNYSEKGTYFKSVWLR